MFTLISQWNPGFQARTVWPERFHLWNLQKRVDRQDWPLNLVLCFRSSPSVKHSLCLWQVSDLELSAILHSHCPSSFIKQECHCTSVFTFQFLLCYTYRAQGYNTQDSETSNPLPPFHPAHPPGVCIEDCKTRADIGKFLRPLDFLKLFFTPCLIGMLCTYTNDYANAVGPQKPSLYQSWSNTYPEEFYHFIGLLMYMSIVHSI